MATRFSVTEQKARQWLPIVEQKFLGETYTSLAAKHAINPKTLSWYVQYFKSKDGVEMIQKINGSNSTVEVVGVRTASRILKVRSNVLHRCLNKHHVPEGHPHSAIRASDYRQNGFTWKWRNEQHLRDWWSVCRQVDGSRDTEEVGKNALPNNAVKVVLDTSDHGIQFRVSGELMSKLTELHDRLNDPIVRKYRKLMGQQEELKMDKLVNMILELGISNWDAE